MSDLIRRKQAGEAWETAVDEGGGSAGSPVVRGPFPFAFDTPNIENGVAFYTPTINDILLDGWIEVDVAFDGTTPKGDISQFTGAASPRGLFSWLLSFAIDLAFVDSINGGGGPMNNSEFGNKNVGFNASGATTQRSFGKFVSVDPMQVVVSQNGQKGGAAVGGTAGSGAVYLVTATPVA